jgi:CheY-specific phosphatase CheX
VDVDAITFEEVMFTIMSATQDTINTYLGIEVFAGKVERGIEPVHSDVVGIIGVGGDRVGYVLFSANVPTARRVAQTMLSAEEPSEDEMRDAVGELTNNIAGLFKNKFQEQYGNVALGLPLVVSGSLRPIGADGPVKDHGPSVNVQFKGVTIPFRSMDGTLAVRVMVLL